MFDVAPSEFILVLVVALVVIGPKDMPRVLRMVGKWVGKARSVANQFRSGFDEMVRQAELEDLEKKWAADNARIMEAHPSGVVDNVVSDAGEAVAPASAKPDMTDLPPATVPATAPAKPDLP